MNIKLDAHRGGNIYISSYAPTEVETYEYQARRPQRWKLMNIKLGAHRVGNL